MTTTAPPTTRSTAAKVAEDVTLDELASLIAQTDAFTILAPNRKRRYVTAASDPRITETGSSRRLFVAYTYCNRRGYAVGATLSVGHSSRRADVDPVFDFYNLGRVVRLAAEEA